MRGWTVNGDVLFFWKYQKIQPSQNRHLWHN